MTRTISLQKMQMASSKSHRQCLRRFKSCRSRFFSSFIPFFERRATSFQFQRFTIRLSKRKGIFLLSRSSSEPRWRLSPRPKSWGARCSRGRSFHRPRAAKAREKKLFVAIEADDFPPSRRGPLTFSAQPHLPTHIVSRYDPSGDSARSRVDAEPARVACVARLRRARARDRVSRVCRETKVSSTNPPSRRPATDPRPPSDSIEPSADGFQGRFHFLLHLRVCQRGSPRQARGPGA